MSKIGETSGYSVGFFVLSIGVISMYILVKYLVHLLETLPEHSVDVYAPKEKKEKQE